MTAMGVKVLEDHDLIVIVVSGVRDEAVGERGIAEFARIYPMLKGDKILMDLRAAINATEPGAMMRRALEAGRVLRPSRVAILTHDPEDMIARIYRKAAAEAGHEALIFTDLDEARVWLDWRLDADSGTLA